jgi:hypothetical protein
LPIEFAAVADSLADEVSGAAEPPEARDETPKVIADLRAKALVLAGLRPADAELAAVAAEAHTIHAEAAGHLERLLSLPRPPGEAEMFVESFLRGLVFDYSGVAGSLERAGERREALMAEARWLIALGRRHEEATRALPRIAARFAGPPAAEQPLAIDLDAAWGPCGTDDRIALTNRSGLDLHNVTVEVELRDRGGRSERNVHFVARWPAGGRVYARYSQGRELLGEVVGRETVPAVESVGVSVWSDELSREGMAYAYAGPERDADVARCCAGMRVISEYRPRSSGLLWTAERRVVVRLAGVRHLESPRVAVTFRRGGLESTLSWDFPRWVEGEEKTLDTGGRLDWDPEGFLLVTVALPETNYRHQSVSRVP